ncbi:unnamed protein product [Blepharisma stoltei]|uniref:Peptidase M20 dimerisation domain-containing protein n=1 Tax=Blepharisma stoltei TaxID=1481888 RepID=A0AAU9ITE6_9CILI|nr:unnamed protein product [Blepharisma stoltei]
MIQGFLKRFSKIPNFHHFHQSLKMDSQRIQEVISQGVDSGVIPTLMDYIRIPSLSTAFDPNWETNGYMEQAQEVLLSYVRSLNIEGFTYEIVKEPGKPWLVFGEVQATAPDKGTILMYGHMDKQPHLSGWTVGGPTDPVIVDGKLYGRGGGDDGYALPGAALCIKTLQSLGIPHGRIVIVAENEEESDSESLVYYINKLRDRIGSPELIVCLDSGIMNYQQFFITTSLRGVVNIDVTVKTILAGMHSGGTSGVLPSAYRIMQHIISRIEDERTGEILIPELHTEIKPSIYEGAAQIVKFMGPYIVGAFPLINGVKPMTDDLVQLLINRSWKPTLTVIGCEGLPPVADAGNVIQPHFTTRLSVRLPPGVSGKVATEALIREITRDPLYNAVVEVTPQSPSDGWAQNDLEPWLNEAVQEASNSVFHAPALNLWEGGSIPFMGYLGELFPSAQFVITGILHLESNPHSINENFSIEYLKKALSCVAYIIGKHASK